MKFTFAILLVVSFAPFAASLRADFNYQETTQVTGSAPVTITHLIQGNRAAAVSHGRITVIDLDRETVTEIDSSKKTYFVIPFADLKKKSPPAAAFDSSARLTGQTRAVGVLTAKERVITLTSEGSSNQVVADIWAGSIPGFDDVREFDRKLGEKLGIRYASDLARIAADRPEIANGLEAAAVEMNKLDLAPLQVVVRIGAAGAIQARAAEPEPSAGVSAALGRIKLGRKKKTDPPADSVPEGLVIEIRTQLDAFSSGPADASKFEVPGGFKKIDPPPGK